ncbi:MAG: peptidoglycan hydrolase-like protein with peptidoglycan-binding domain [Planctomycetota bacterium]|jgi:peptidoglycan hydrolase-like protein with peptidoglycan-binding domain
MRISISSPTYHKNVLLGIGMFILVILGVGILGMDAQAISTSTSFQLEGAIDPITGTSSSTNYILNMTANESSGDGELASTNFKAHSGLLGSVEANLFYESDNFHEAVANDGSIGNTMVLTLENDLFTVQGGTMTQGTHYNVNNVPTGLSVAITTNYAKTRALVTLSGNAALHTDSDGISNLEITFLDAAFNANPATQVSASSRTDIVVDYIDPSGGVLDHSGFFYEDPPNPGQVLGSVVMTLNSDTFAAALSLGAEVVVTDVPTGLSAAISRDSGTQATLTLSGTAAAHSDAEDTTGIVVIFADSAFVTNTASNIGGSAFTEIEVDFHDTGDVDGDGADDTIEDLGPNSGDGDNDGTADKYQSHVSTFVNPLTSDFATIKITTTSTCVVVSSGTIVTEASLGTDTNYEYPVGLADFELRCLDKGATVGLDVYYHDNPSTSNWDTHRKYYPATSTFGTASISSHAGSAPPVMSVTLTDGVTVDDTDLLLDGYISDPVGPATDVTPSSGGSSGGSQGGGSSGQQEEEEIVSAPLQITPTCSPIFFTNLKTGARGTVVTTMQQFLSDQGINPGAIDGVFGGKTFRAVQEFQERYPSQILTPIGETSGTGHWLSYTQAQANVVYCGGAIQTPANDIDLDLLQNIILNKLGGGENTCEPIFFTDLKRGAKGEAVRDIQAFLVGRGYNPGAIDGMFGRKTYQAVVDFQEKYTTDILLPIEKTSGTGHWLSYTQTKANTILCAGSVALPVTSMPVDTGILPPVIPVVRPQADSCPVRFKLNLRRGDRSPAVQDMQAFLVEQGINPGSVDGIFGRKTFTAVQRFQERYPDEILTPVGDRSGTGHWLIFTKTQANVVFCQGYTGVSTAVIQPATAFISTGQFATAVDQVVLTPSLVQALISIMQTNLNAGGESAVDLEAPTPEESLTEITIEEVQRALEAVVPASQVSIDVLGAIVQLLNDTRSEVEAVVVSPSMATSLEAPVVESPLTKEQLEIIMSIFRLQQPQSVVPVQSQVILSAPTQTAQVIIPPTPPSSNFPVIVNSLDMIPERCEQTFRYDMSLGDRSTDIGKLQRYFVAINYYHGPINGRFTQELKRAVVAYQNVYYYEILQPLGITDATGIVSVSTRDHINDTICILKIEDEL